MILSRRAAEPKDVSLQMISMIDIVFLLVIFFMCTTDLTRLQVDEDITLPVAHRGSEGGEPRLVVNVCRDGAVRVLARSYDRRALEGFLAEEALRGAGADGRSALAVKVRADADVPYRFVQEVLTACRQAKIWKLSFGVSPGERARTAE